MRIAIVGFGTSGLPAAYYVDPLAAVRVEPASLSTPSAVSRQITSRFPK